MAISQSWLLSTSGSVVAETSSLDYGTSVAVSDFYDKEYNETDSTVVGAYKL